MAYYMKKNPKDEEKNQKPQPASREKKFFYQILGCVIVLVIATIIWAVKG